MFDMFLKMTQNRPSASCASWETSGYEPTSAFKLTGVSRQITEVPARQCAAQKNCAAQTDAPDVRHTKLSLLNLSLLDSCSSALARQATRRALETGAIRLSLEPLFKHGCIILLNPRKHKLEPQPRYIHLLLQQRPLTRACLYDNQCWFVMLTVAFALARTVSRLHFLLQKA